MSARAAIYFAPPSDDPLWRFGSSLLGYDAATGTDLRFPSGLPVDEAEWSRWTEEPRTYGFHGTLKAPFRLADGVDFDDVVHVAREMAARRAPFRVPRLGVRLIGSFVALVLADPDPGVDDLAAACVTAFDPLRAPLTDAERARRLKAPLSPRQIELLDRYGYPYVLDQFRFHMTITGALPAARAEAVRTHLAEMHFRLEPGLTFGSICVFAQGAPDQRFRVLERIPFATSRAS